jgi:hypothetical protein
VRGIALSSTNIHDDSELARDVIQLAKRLRFKSSHVARRLDDDLRQLEEIVREESKAEIRLKSGGVAWEITRKGARQGTLFIPTAEVAVLRWGTLITRDGSAIAHDFRFHVAAANGQRIQFDWVIRGDATSAKKTYEELISAAFEYLYPAVCTRIEKRLKAGERIVIGPCTLTSIGIGFRTKGWFSTNDNFVPWATVRTAVENGEIVVSDARSPKTRISYPLRDTDNASVLPYLTRAMGRQEG